MFGKKLIVIIYIGIINLYCVENLINVNFLSYNILMFK
jgi:hypothetical protein